MARPRQESAEDQLGTNKEVINVELYAMWEALVIARKNGRAGHGTSRTPADPRKTRVHIWAGSQATIRRLEHTAPGSGQWQANLIIERTMLLGEHEIVVVINSGPGHMVVEGNEKANNEAKEAAEGVNTTRGLERFAFLTHIGQTISQKWLMEVKHWFPIENDKRPLLQ